MFSSLLVHLHFVVLLLSLRVQTCISMLLLYIYVSCVIWHEFYMQRKNYLHMYYTGYKLPRPHLSKIYSESISSWVLYFFDNSHIKLTVRWQAAFWNLWVNTVHACSQFPNNLFTPGQSFYSKQIPCIILCVVSWG